MAENTMEVALSKSDIGRICYLSEQFSEALGQEVSPIRVIEICTQVLVKKASKNGIISILELIKEDL